MTLATMPPTGQEPVTPVTLLATSVTERADFRMCRRRWFLNTLHRLVPAGGVINFWFGNMVHYALEHYYLAGAPHLHEEPRIYSQDEREEYALVAYHDYAEESLEGVAKELGFLWESAKDDYLEMLTMGEGMLEGYFRMDSETGGFGKVIAIEERYRVPILTPSGRALPGKPEITGRFDLVVEKEDGTYWIIDHKTAAQKHNSAHLDIDDQLTGYAYVFYRATGIMPRGQVYNVLLKKVPRGPKVIKNGAGLSQDKAQNTTYSLYVDAIKENGFSRRDYREMLDYLKAKGWEDYYTQEGVFRNMRQIERFEHDLYNEFLDMRRVARFPEQAYPNPTPFTCPGCPVKKICSVMQDQGDFAAVIVNDYTIAPPRE